MTGLLKTPVVMTAVFLIASFCQMTRGVPLLLHGVSMAEDAKQALLQRKASVCDAGLALQQCSEDKLFSQPLWCWSILLPAAASWGEVWTEPCRRCVREPDRGDADRGRVREVVNSAPARSRQIEAGFAGVSSDGVPSTGAQLAQAGPLYRGGDRGNPMICTLAGS